MSPDTARHRLTLLRQKQVGLEVLQELAAFAVELEAAARSSTVIILEQDHILIEKARLVGEALAVGPLGGAEMTALPHVQDSLACFERRIVGEGFNKDLSEWIAKLTGEARAAADTIVGLETSVAVLTKKIRVLEQYQELLVRTM